MRTKDENDEQKYTENRYYSEKEKNFAMVNSFDCGMIFLSLVITLFSVSKVAKIYHQVEKQELLDEVTHSLNNGKKQLVTSQGSNPFYIDIKASESGTDTIVVTLIVENDYVSFVKNDMPMIKKSIIEGMESAEGIKLTKSEHQWVKEMNFKMRFVLKDKTGKILGGFDYKIK